MGVEWDTNSGEPGIGGRGITELYLLLNFSVNLKLSKNYILHYRQTKNS